MRSFRFPTAPLNPRPASSRAVPAARLALLLACAALPGLAACSLVAPTKTTRGNLVDGDALKELVPGTSTRADVTALLGSPTAHATFDDNTWIYIGQVTQTRVGRLPGVDRQQVVVLDFDPAGTLLHQRVLDKDDSYNVSMASGATRSPGSEASFLQQLLGNVGRFSPGGLGAGSGPAGTGVGSSSGQ